MASKTIMLCNGPLSGQLTSVPENMTEYVFFQRYDGSVLDKKISDEDFIAKRRLYCKSQFKFGENEIFIWEEDVPLESV